MAAAFRAPRASPATRPHMIDPVYSLNLIPTGDGTFVSAKNSPAGGMGAVYLSPLGGAFSDVFRKSRAPSPRELIQQLVGTAYACASLNSDLVASARLRLYVATRPGDARAKAYLRARPIARKTLAHLKDSPASG